VVPGKDSNRCTLIFVVVLQLAASLFQTEVKEDVSVVGLALSSRKNLCIHPEVGTVPTSAADPGSAAF
jgi:hypothetical protein